jgi:hypothetical protein
MRLEFTRTRATIKGLLRKALWFFWAVFAWRCLLSAFWDVFSFSAERNMVRETELMNSE